MAGRRKKKSKLVEIQYSIGLMLFCGLLILIVTLPDILREYEYRTASDTLRSWEYEYSPRRKYTNSKVWFEVNIGERIHRIGAVTYMPLKQGTPYYADEFEEILNAHIGDTVDYTYRRDSHSTIVHMEIDGEVIVDQEIVLSQYEDSTRFALIFVGVCFGIGFLLIPHYIVLKRRRKHARLSSRRAAGKTARPRG